jgi:starch-binding outer membrane protein, SusD/RagB family
MKAEALVRRDGGNSATATDLVNAIRARAFPNMPSKLYSSVTLDNIMMERRFELAWEGYARQDKIRFGHFGDPIPGWKDYSDPVDVFDNPQWFPEGHTHYDLFPIPQQAITANPNLMQNPGYPK